VCAKQRTLMSELSISNYVQTKNLSVYSFTLTAAFPLCITTRTLLRLID